MQTDTLDWILSLKTGSEVGVYYQQKLMYTEKVKSVYPDAIVLQNNTQFSEYGDEIQLQAVETSNKQYLGPI